MRGKERERERELTLIPVRQDTTNPLVTTTHEIT